MDTLIFATVITVMGGICDRLKFANFLLTRKAVRCQFGAKFGWFIQVRMWCQDSSVNDKIIQRLSKLLVECVFYINEEKLCNQVTELASATIENALSEQNWRWWRSECAFTRRAAGSSSGWGCGMSAQSLDGSGLLFQRDTCRERLGEVLAGSFILRRARRRPPR